MSTPEVAAGSVPGEAFGVRVRAKMKVATILVVLLVFDKVLEVAAVLILIEVPEVAAVLEVLLVLDEVLKVAAVLVVLLVLVAAVLVLVGVPKVAAVLVVLLVLDEALEQVRAQWLGQSHS